MCAYNLSYNREAESGAVLFCREERIEYLRKLIGCHPFARIPDVYLHRSGVGDNGDAGLAVGAARCIARARKSFARLERWFG